MMAGEIPARLQELLMKLTEDQLGPDDQRDLADILIASEEAQQHYERYIDVHTTLQWSLEPPDELDLALVRQSDGLTEEIANRSVSPLTSPVPERAGQSEAEITDKPNPMLSPARLKSWSDRAYRRVLRPSIAVATVVTVVGLIWAAVTYLPNVAKQDNQQKPNSEAEFVAWYMGDRDAKWIDGTEPKQTRLKLGQQLAIEKGLIEIQYRTGAEVVIEGPAKFYVGGTEAAGGKDAQAHKGTKARRDDLANSGYLALGKLVARVDGEDAQGFFIDTPNARVEDLGTEFGVEVRAGGGTSLLVFDGRVVLKTGSDLEITSKLATNQAASVAAGIASQIVVWDASDAKKLSRRFRRSTEPSLLGRNLIVNPGAEVDEGRTEGAMDMRITGWHDAGSATVIQYSSDGGFPNADSPGPPANKRGKNFFGGGQSAGSKISQRIDIGRLKKKLDAGQVRFELSVYLGGYINQNDRAWLVASFQDAFGRPLDSKPVQVGPVTNQDRNNITGLLRRTASGVVPVGTRVVEVTMQFTREIKGGAADGYADNLSIVLRSD